LGYNYAKKGSHAEAAQKLAELKAISTGYVSPDYKAWIHVGLGQTNEAIACLEEACEQRSRSLVSLKIDPLWEPLRLDPRFQAVLRKVGLDK
jgi:hypothetical protein